MAYTKEEWWHTDKEGRRIGWLWPEDMEAILESAYGARKWVNTFAQKFGFARSTVDRWRDGTVPIPKHVAMIINMISSNNVRGIPTPDIDADWLPDVEGSKAKLTADAVTE